MSAKMQLRLFISKSLKKLNVTFLTILWIMLSYHCMKKHEVMSFCKLKGVPRKGQKTRITTGEAQEVMNLPELQPHLKVPRRSKTSNKSLLCNK